MAGTFDVATALALPGGPAADDFIPVKRPGVAGLFKADLLGLAQPSGLTVADLTALILSLPTSLPSSPGELWLNGGTLSIS